MPTKPWYRSKTMWFNLAVAAGPLVAYAVANPTVAQMNLTPTHFLTYSFLIGAVNVGLRTITSTGIGIFGSDTPPAP